MRTWWRSAAARQRDLVAGAVVVLLAALFSAALWRGPEPTAYHDSYWYLTTAQVNAGTDQQEAALASAALVCRENRRSALAQRRPEPCDPENNLVGTARWSGLSPRYVAIFTARPGLPLVATPAVKMLGPWRGMQVTVLGLAVLAGLGAFAAARLAGGSRLAGISAAVLLMTLPTGFWVTRILAEGAAVVGTLGVVAGALALPRSPRIGSVVLGSSFAWLMATKSANGATLAVAAIGVSLVLAGWSPTSRSQARRLALLCTVVLASSFGLQALLRLPGGSESLQDFATVHFQSPDVRYPLMHVLRGNAVWGTHLYDLLRSPWPLVLMLLAALTLAARGAWVSAVVALPAVSAVAVYVAHPVPAEYQRLIAPLWVTLAVGLALAVDVLRHALARQMDVRSLKIAQDPHGKTSADRGTLREGSGRHPAGT